MNPFAALRPLTADFWEWDMPGHRYLGVQLGRRMSIARLPDGTLWLHSPIDPTDEIRATLAHLGPVAHLVGPNVFHDAFLTDAQLAWPDAVLHGAPGLAKANKRLRVANTLTSEAPPAWAGVIDQHLIQGIRWLNEVVFFHRASRTIIFADLAFNFGPDRDFTTRSAMTLYGIQGRFKADPLLRILLKDRAALRASIDRILNWDFDRVMLGHGDTVETGGKDAVRTAFAYLK